MKHIHFFSIVFLVVVLALPLDALACDAQKIVNLLNNEIEGEV